MDGLDGLRLLEVGFFLREVSVSIFILRMDNEHSPWHKDKEKTRGLLVFSF
jgi:hypothetical protein